MNSGIRTYHEVDELHSDLPDQMAAQDERGSARLAMLSAPSKSRSSRAASNPATGLVSSADMGQEGTLIAGLSCSLDGIPSGTTKERSWR